MADLERVHMENVDFGKAATDYATHRAGFPERLWDDIEDLGVAFKGTRTVDLGTGTGAVARALALRDASVTGIDPSVPLTTEAARLDRDAGVSVTYVTAKAEATTLERASADLVIAGQCWWWFDKQAALAEARRLLVPGGRLIICSFDWLPLPGNVVEATEALIVQANPKWTLGGKSGRHPDWTDDLTGGSFDDIKVLEFDDPTPYTHQAWRGRIRASAGVAATLPPADADRFDERLAQMLADRFPADPLIAPHRVFAAIGTAPAQP